VWRRHLILLSLAGTASAAALAFPWLIENLPALGAGIALFFSQLCHQNPARSFVLAGATLPVCVRCLAMYLGGFAGIAAYPALSFRVRQYLPLLRFLALTLGLMFMDISLDVTGLWRNTVLSRATTGALFGGACGLLVSLAIQPRRSVPPESPQPN
jgi:uncharacterized membrane protein